MVGCMAISIDNSIFVVCLVTTIKCYRTNFKPLGHEAYWPVSMDEDECVMIPDTNTIRKKGKPSSKQKNEMDVGSSTQRTQHCGRCRVAGHNKKTCLEHHH